MAPVGLDIIMRRLCTYTPRYYGLCPRPDVDQIAARPPSGVCGKRWRNRSKVSVRSLILSFFLVFLSSRLLVCNLFFFSWPRDTLFSIPTAIVISFLFFLSLSSYYDYFREKRRENNNKAKADVANGQLPK